MKFIIPVSALLLTLGGSHAQTQALVFNDATRGGNWPGAISSYDLQATVEGLVSRNVLTLAFKDIQSDRGDSLEMTYRFNLPQGSVVDSLYLWVGDEKVPAAMKSAWTAFQIYGSIVRGRLDPALLTTSGNGFHQLRVFPFARRQERRVQICYSTPLTPAFDRLRLEVPLQLTSPSAVLVGRIQVDIRAPGIGKDRISIASGDSSAWEKGESGGEARIAYRASDAITNAPAYIHLDHPTLGRDGIAVHFDKDASGETHFMAVMNPRKALGQPERKRKRKVLALWNLVGNNLFGDGYGNRFPVKTFYYGSGMDQEGRDIAEFLRATLSPGDELNFIFNDLSLKAFRTGLAPVTAGTFPALVAFIEQSIQNRDPDDQSTGAEDLLTKGLSTLAGIDSAEVIIIDRYSPGYWQDTTYTDPANAEGILAKAPKGLTAFVVTSPPPGPGITFKSTKLASVYQELARRSQGALIRGGEPRYSVAPYLEGLKPYFSMRIYPASLTFSGGAAGFAYDVFGIPDMFHMDQNVVVMGKLSALEALTVRLQGRAGGEDVAFSKEFPVVRPASPPRLPKLWGARKVESLLGTGYYSPRFWEEATDWSLYYRILTPVTALLALEPGRFDSTWYQDQKPGNNPNLPSRLGGGARKRRAPGKLALTQEPGFLVIDLSGFDPSGAGFTLQVFDGRGRMVADLTAEAGKGGKQLRWATGSLRKGGYVLRLRTGGRTLVRAFTIR